jgi:hypothetical protein
MARVYDCVLYSGELEVLCLRLRELRDVVNTFVVAEATETFSGLPKTPSFRYTEPRIASYRDRIHHLIVEDRIQASDPWEREAFQRNALVRGFADAASDDLILVSDVDEIPRARVVRDMLAGDADTLYGLRMALYYFFINFRNTSGAEVHGVCTAAGRRRALAGIPPNSLRQLVRRAPRVKRVDLAGWHFSMLLMGTDAVRSKIRAFSHQELNNKDFLAAIDVERLVRDRRDLCGRSYTWAIKSDDLPEWLEDCPELRKRLSWSADATPCSDPAIRPPFG